MDTNAVIYQDLDRILVTREDIAKAVKELGQKLTEKFRGMDAPARVHTQAHRLVTGPPPGEAEGAARALR